MRKTFPCRRATHRRPRGLNDNGFVLLETLVSIGLISVVMAAFTTFFINTVAFTSQQRATQIATQIASSAVDAVRSVPASDLPLNGSMADVPATQTINNVVYQIVNSITACVIPAGMTQGGSCGSPKVKGIPYLRATVMVTWAGTRCPPSRCAFVTSTLLSAVDDPLFNPNQAPPPTPTLTSPGPQLSAIGDTINLPATLSAAPTYSVAVTSGSLPAGLVLTPATGLISGTPSALTPTAPITLTLTDGYGRATTTTFTWTVVAALVATPPAAQANFIGAPLSLTLPAASGGVPGYTWSDPGSTLPPGLTLTTVDNLGTISGTPTTRGVFPVKLTVTDSSGTRNAIVGFSWTTDYPPLVASNPGPQTSTAGTADAVTLTVTGGSGSVNWTGGATLPAGLTLSAAGVVSGTPKAAGVTSVALLVTDTKAGTQQNVAFTWTVYDRPTVTSPGNQSVTSGAALTLQLATTCPNAPCSYQVTNGPGTFGISSSGLLTGTVTSAAQTFTNVAIAVTDSSAATVTSPSFTVTVNAAPKVSSPGNQTVPPGVAVSMNVAGLTTGGTAPLTYSAVKLPSWLTLNTSTGSITGTAPNNPGTTSGTILTVTDSFGVSASSAAFSWTTGGGPPSTPLAVVVINGDSAVTSSWAAPTFGPVTSYTATVSPGGASCTTAGLSCAISRLTNGVVYSLTVTATNGAGTGPASTGLTAIPYPGVMSANNGLTLWLDGADPGVQLGSSDCTGPVTTTTIGCWKDKSGQSAPNNFVQATAANQPRVSTWNGLPAANFADTSDVLNSANPATNYQTVFMAANVTNSGVYINLFSQSGVDYNVRIGSGVSRSAPNGNDWSFNPSGTLNWTNGAKLVNANGPLKIITADQARTVKSFTASVSNALYGRGLVGQVGDVITFDRPLTTPERRSVEEYLARKWAVPITPAAPASVTGVVSGPNAANVSWVAPPFNGGAGVTQYTVTSTPGGKSCSTTGLSCTVNGLPHDIAYTFTVSATNSVGLGPASASSNAVNP